jgi:hypothetical protein
MAPINTATENRTRASLNLATPEPIKGEIEFAMSLAPIENNIRADTAKPCYNQAKHLQYDELYSHITQF